MGLKFERMLTFGPVIDCNHPEAWPKEVEALYERLKRGDCTALAPLLALDLEFIRDIKSLGALICLKYNPDYPASVARRELNKIANIIRRRPVRRGYLPYGDMLHTQLHALRMWFISFRLLQLKKDPAALRARLKDLLTRSSENRKTLPDGVLSVQVGWETSGGEVSWRPDPEPRVLSQKERKDIDRICKTMVEAVRPFGRYVRSERSWALHTLSLLHDVEPRQIEKRIDRDPLVRAMKLPKRPRHRSK